MSCEKCKHLTVSPVCGPRKSDRYGYVRCAGGLFDCGKTGKPILRPAHETCEQEATDD